MTPFKINSHLVIDNQGEAIEANHNVRSGFEQTYLFMSDIHFDSKHCDRELLRRHMELAKTRGAAVFIFGDLFDCMGGKYDKRTDKADIRDEYQRPNYFDAIVEDAARWFSPYKRNIAMVSLGNHEQTVLKRHEMDLIDAFIARLGGGVIKGGYNGWIRFAFKKEGMPKGIMSKVMYYTHGDGGNSPITKGVIGTNRRQVAIHSDYYLTGHLHNEWEVPLTRVRLNVCNRQVIEKVKHWQLGTYCNTWMGKWETRMGFSAPTLGGRWLKYYFLNNNILEESYIAE